MTLLKIQRISLVYSTRMAPGGIISSAAEHAGKLLGAWATWGEKLPQTSFPARVQNAAAKAQGCDLGLQAAVPGEALEPTSATEF